MSGKDPVRGEASHLSRVTKKRCTTCYEYLLGLKKHDVLSWASILKGVVVSGDGAALSFCPSRPRCLSSCAQAAADRAQVLAAYRERVGGAADSPVSPSARTGPTPRGGTIWECCGA